MADEINISYSFQTSVATQTPATAPTIEAPLIAFTGCDRVDLDNNSVLLLNRSNGKQVIVTPEVASALTSCTTFTTLQEHAQQLVSTIPQLHNQLADVTKVLQFVDDAGLMLHAQTVCDRLAPETTATTELAPTRVCIITCDRPAAVERLLDSMLEAGKLSRHDALFLVDDSRDQANCEKNRAAVVRFNSSSAKNMHYVGDTEQSRLLQQLVAAQPEEEEAIRFLIDRERWQAHMSYGLSRTVCLLLSVGYRCIMLDDDVLCRSVLPPRQDKGISFGSGSNRELACYDSQQHLLQNARYGDADPLSGHARCLGMNLAEALGELDTGKIEPATLRDSNAAILNTFRGDSPILVTQCGTWGDPGTTNSHWFYHLGPDSVNRLLASSNGLRGAMDNRHYWLGRTRAHISNMALMSQATGLDNSRLLPPYFPVFRGEDCLFASMALYLHPDSAVLDHAWCVPHLPLEQRSGQGAPDPIAARGGAKLCALYLADRVDSTGGTCLETRLKKLALLLRELGERDPPDLLADFRRELSREHALQLQLLNRQLQRPAGQDSQEWADYLRGGIEEVSSAVQSPTSPVNIPGVPGNVSEDELLLQIKTLMGQFSEAITAWPSIRSAAAAIAGQMLASGELEP